MIPKLIRQREKSYSGRNITRCYYIVNPKPNGEARIDVWAVKNEPKTKKLVAKKIVRYHTDRKRYDVRSVMRSCTFNFLSVNWSEMPWGNKHMSVWEDVDSGSSEWGYCDYHFKRDLSQVFMYGEYLNGFDKTKYAKCGWNYTYLHPMQYFECWNISHATEFLAKGNLQRFISPSFVKKLRDDKAFFNYFRSSIQQIKQGYYGKGAVLRAFRTGESLNEADTHLKNNMWLVASGCHIPKEVDRNELFKWLDGDTHKLYQYNSYCNSIRVVGADITAHGMMFPTIRTMDIINEQAEVIRTQQRTEEERRHIRRMAEAERRFRKAERKRLREEKKKWERIQQAIARIEKTDYLARLAIVFPKKQAEFKAEGNYMHNCIGSVYRAGDRDNIIGFIRKDGKPYADFRIDAETMKLAEVRYRDNEDATEEFGSLVSELASKIDKDINKKMRKVA